MAAVRVIVHDREVERLKADPGLRDVYEDLARPAVAAARSGAPHATGAGAGSIHTETVLDGDEWEGLISWDREHFYLRFHELGSRYLPARPFLVPAVKGAAR